MINIVEEGYTFEGNKELIMNQEVNYMLDVDNEDYMFKLEEHKSFL